MNKKPHYHLHSSIDKITRNKKVLLRADLNVLLKNGIILDDFRLKALQPTLNVLQENNAHTLIVTHIGRPKGHDESLSTKHLIPWFTQHNYDCIYASTIEKAEILLSTHNFVLLENIRFWPEEKKQDKLFAKSFKNTTDIYVMDAFASSHRSDTSIKTLPELYEKNKRTIGLLVERELQKLNKLLINPQKPFNLLLGGAKIETKLPLVQNLSPNIGLIALLPPLSLNAEIQKTIEKDPEKFLLPKDYLVASDWKDISSYKTSETIPSDKIALTIGPQTIASYSEKLNSSQTFFFNGASGDIRYPKTCDAINKLLKNICQVNAFKIGAGGDTVAMIQQCKKTTCFDFLSTGGGAALQYLSGQPLPGLSLFV